MDRKLVLIAIAAVALAGIGVGVLLANFEGGPLEGSIVPNTTVLPATMTVTPPPVVIWVDGSYSPYRSWNSDNGYVWYWDFHSVTTHDASNLPPGVVLQKVEWTITGTLEGGRTTLLVNHYMERYEGIPGYSAPRELPVTYTNDINDRGTQIGCHGTELCPSSAWMIRPPFRARCTITTTDGFTYTRSVELACT